MARDESFKVFVLDQLSDLPGVTSRAMFGGYGLYLNGEIFAILSKDRVFFKTDADSQSEYSQRGMEPFQPGEKQILKSYYELPADILEDSDEIVAWAKRAAQASTPKSGAKNKK